METMLRQERMARNWTQDFVAKQIGIKKSTVQMLETGRRKPSYEVLVKLLDLFNYSDPRKLFGVATPDNTPSGYHHSTGKVNKSE